jgi:hypothetical protein
MAKQHVTVHEMWLMIIVCKILFVLLNASVRFSLRAVESKDVAEFFSDFYR